MGFFSELLGGDAGKATKKAAVKNQGLINAFDTKGQGIIDTGETRSEGALNNASSLFQPYADTGIGANTMYSNALGLNGADGNAAATSAFQAGPGYEFALNPGTQAALRGASAAGSLASGNTLTALSQFGQGLANQEYGTWLQRLQAQASQGMQAAGSQAQTQTGLANLYQKTAGDRLGLGATVVQGLTSSNNQLAQGQEMQAKAKSGMLGNLVGLGSKVGLF
ncbi:hypothetical protein IFT84_13100 [Rhizobium sp. CFBP 8762]|uniref:hypothetical protein n=1 Tax=Rhizobium sp. CFBP 8762 TaxID=2775279 RepID=UPI001785A5E9|nr:hypothetical protein [Rhizobium sp. CFBP 8762]MBD8555442.1 hypothetical protein [Rhizobium sp. CFBP 8762]